MMWMTMAMLLSQGCRNCNTETETFIVEITEEPHPTEGTVTVDGETIELTCWETNTEYFMCEADIPGGGVVTEVTITIEEEEISLDPDEAYYEKAECKMSGRYVLSYP